MKIARRFIYLLSIIAPLYCLKDLKATFYSGLDWNNQLWLIGYFGEFFRHHFTMPVVINTSNAIGVTIPIFYGTLLYPLIGVLASIVGASLALRLACFMMLTFQFYGIYSGGKSIFHNRFISYVIAATSIWSTYSLTNLYNRSAITEYFATGLMMAAIGFIFAAINEAIPNRKTIFLWMAGFSIILFLGIHPPTAFIGGIYFSILTFLFLINLINNNQIHFPVFKIQVIQGVLLILCLAPWIYATLTIGPHLIQWNHPGVIQFFPDRSDSWIGRLYPFPYDKVSATKGITDISTPYLETNVNFGYILLSIYLSLSAIINRDALKSGPNKFIKKSLTWTIVITLIWIIFITTLSVSRSLASHFLFLNQFVQFAYRFVSHINAALLVFIFSLGLIINLSDKTKLNKKTFSLLATACIVVASFSLNIKLKHASEVLKDEDSKEYMIGEDHTQLAKSAKLGLVHMYATSDNKIRLTEQESKNAVCLNFSVDTTGNSFGTVYKSHVNLTQANWVITNVVNYPWSKITINNKEVTQTRTSYDGTFIAILVPQGDNVLEWQWIPNTTWSSLYQLSYVSLFALVTSTMILLFILIRDKTIFF